MANKNMKCLTCGRAYHWCTSCHCNDDNSLSQGFCCQTCHLEWAEEKIELLKKDNETQGQIINRQSDKLCELEEEEISNVNVQEIGEKPLGTSHWAGMVDGCPAVTLSYHGGATLFYFRYGWKKKTFPSLAECHDWLMIER